MDEEEGALLPLDTVPLALPRNFLAGPQTRRVASSLANVPVSSRPPSKICHDPMNDACPVVVLTFVYLMTLRSKRL